MICFECVGSFETQRCNNGLRERGEERRNRREISCFNVSYFYYRYDLINISFNQLILVFNNNKIIKNINSHNL